MNSQSKQAGRKQYADLTSHRRFMQIALPLILPTFSIGALVSLLRLEHPYVALAVGPLALAGALALGYYIRVASKRAAAASKREVPRWLYGSAGLCFLPLTFVMGRLAFAESHATGNEAFSITLGFLAFYCAIAGGLFLGRALARGPKRLIFWIFVPRWLASELKQHHTPPRRTA